MSAPSIAKARSFYSRLLLVILMSETIISDMKTDSKILSIDPIHFDILDAEKLKTLTRKAIEKHDAEIAAITANKELPTFFNTIAALDRSGAELTDTWLTLNNLESALGTEEYMQAVAELSPELSEHSTSILLNSKLWKRVQYVYENERGTLQGEDLRLLEETYSDFIDSGAALDEEKKRKFSALKSRLSELTVKFGQNVAMELSNPSNRLWVEQEEMEGIPADIAAAARAEAKSAFEDEGNPDDDTKYLFTLYMPSYAPFMKYQRNRALRERLYRMYAGRNAGGDNDNRAIMLEIANKRLELANLMGYATYADYKLKRTMAHTPSNVYALLDQLRESYIPAMRREIKEIEEFARHTEGDGFKLQPWDYSFWADKLKTERHAFSDEDMKPYFPLQTTIDGVLGLASRLYGYSFRRRDDVEVYHPDVIVFEVYDAEKNLLGLLYADFFSREGKSPGAWMTEFRPESKNEHGEKTLPLISIVCNFPKPVGESPVLLTPGEVRTFLHEFGHALHGLSADTVYASLSGTSVYRDFVETFSQFNENYLTQREFLDSFARHYQSGESMPAGLLDNFLDSTRFGAGYACIRQLGFGYLDMAYHTITSPLPSHTDPAKFESEAQAKVQIFDPAEGCLTGPAFGHIFAGGYAAGYYGYKWAEVLDADAFSVFEREGIFNKATAARFRKMLQSGGTRDPEIMYEEFRRGKPTIDALLRRDGMKR